MTSSTTQILRFPLATGGYPLSIQAFFKTDLNDVESFLMFPLPIAQGGLNPMNIYADGQAVVMSIVAEQPLFARFDPVVGRWDEFHRGYIYVCAFF